MSIEVRLASGLYFSSREPALLLQSSFSPRERAKQYRVLAGCYLCKKRRQHSANAFAGLNLSDSSPKARSGSAASRRVIFIVGNMPHGNV